MTFIHDDQTGMTYGFQAWTTSVDGVFFLPEGTDRNAKNGHQFNERGRKLYAVYTAPDGRRLELPAHADGPKMYIPMDGTNPDVIAMCGEFDEVRYSEILIAMMRGLYTMAVKATNAERTALKKEFGAGWHKKPYEGFLANYRKQFNKPRLAENTDALSDIAIGAAEKLAVCPEMGEFKKMLASGVSMENMFLSEEFTTALGLAIQAVFAKTSGLPMMRA